ncbi:MAG: HEAT repeat domain-containing protein [Euryarchaeota archaeon]|nr:HEAT repeat domain-containing protein [Euryarchaeota archaeon]
MCDAAYDALTDIGEAAINPLISAVDDADMWVRWAAIHALGEIGDLRAVKPLIRLLDDSDESVRDAAARALEAIERKSR